jgi:hypothetical protein
MGTSTILVPEYISSSSAPSDGVSTDITVSNDSARPLVAPSKPLQDLLLWMDGLSCKVNSGVRHEIVNGEIVSIKPVSSKKSRRRSTRLERVLSSDYQRSAVVGELVERRRRDSCFHNLAGHAACEHCDKTQISSSLAPNTASLEFRGAPA